MLPMSRCKSGGKVILLTWLTPICSKSTFQRKFTFYLKIMTYKIYSWFGNRGGVVPGYRSEHVSSVPDLAIFLDVNTMGSDFFKRKKIKNNLLFNYP